MRKSTAEGERGKATHLVLIFCAGLLLSFDSFDGCESFPDLSNKHCELPARFVQSELSAESTYRLLESSIEVLRFSEHFLDGLSLFAIFGGGDGREGIGCEARNG